MEHSHKHFRQTHHEFQLLFAGTFGEAYLAVKRGTDADQDSPSRALDFSPSDHPVPNDLRVVKYHKAGKLAQNGRLADLKNEIEVLKLLGSAHLHPAILPILEWHVDGSVQWLTTPFMGGWNLSHFVQSFPEAVTVPFAWHVGYCVADALLYLSGITSISSTEETKADPSWPCMFHGDLHLGNILPGPDTPAHALLNFAQVVLTDFGEAAYCRSVLRNPPREHLLQ